MNQSMEVLEGIVRSRICGVCSSPVLSGECPRQEVADCALFRLLPQVAAAIQATRSDDIRDYIEAIRERVCALCGEEMVDGSCDQRARGRCALDAYLMLVVDAVEQATGKRFDQDLLAPPALTRVRLEPAISRPGRDVIRGKESIL